MGCEMRVRIILTFILSLTVFANEFSNFTLNTNLENMESAAVYESNDIRNYSNIYDQIQGTYNDNYSLIGNRLANESLSGWFGGVNMIGYRHSNDFSTFKVVFNRSIAPALFEEDKYIVNDEVTIEVDASKFLSQLAQEEIIDISQQNLQAFAGLAFKRTMRFNHFADSVQEGLQTRHDKLFLMYKFFRGRRLAQLNDYDYLTKEDSFTVKAGGLVTAPVLTYGAIGAGALYKYENKAKVTVHKLGPEDKKAAHEALRLSVERSKVRSLGVNAVLIADFFKILRLTLFRYDFELSEEESNKVYLSLTHQDLSNEGKLDQLDHILRYRNFDYDLFAENIVSRELRQKQLMTSKYSLFLIGGVKQSQSENTEIIKDGILHKFFKHSYEKLKYKENFMSRIVLSLLGPLIGYNQLANRTEVSQRLTTIDYEAEIDLLKTKEDYDIFEKNVFTMSLTNKYKFAPDKRLKDSKVKETMVSEIISKTRSYDTFKAPLQNDVTAPSEFNASYIMDNNNVAYFMKRQSNTVYNVFDDVCKVKSKGIFSFFRSLFSGCKKRLYSRYFNFLKEWSSANYTGDLYKVCSKKYRWRYLFRPSKRRKMVAKCMEISSRVSDEHMAHNLPLWRFKDVVSTLHNEFHHINHMKILFGEFNNRGSVNLTSKQGIPYRGYFNEGQVKENIVDQFRMENNLRSPASLQ
jgi:hypothetical protein